MKKILSTIIVAVMLISAMSFSVLAADVDFTLSVSATTASKGDTIIATVTAATNVGIKALGAGVKFDDAFVLGSNQASADDYGTPVWVDYDYLDAYYSLSAAKRWGDPTFGADTAVYPGYTYANAQYAKASAVSSSATDFPVCGVILTVNTDEKTQAVISMPNTYWGDASGTKTTIPEQTITINLNGYGEVEEPTDYDVAYAENSKVIFNTAPATTTDGSVTFNVTPAMGYKISNVAATSGTVDTSYNAAGGNITVNDVAADTTITVSVAEADDTIVTYATALKEGNVVYVFGKVPAASTAGTYGMFVTKDGAALAVPSLDITDGKFAANAASEGAFGIQLTISGDYYKGAYTAATYLGNEIDAESVAFSIN